VDWTLASPEEHQTADPQVDIDARDWQRLGPSKGHAPHNLANSTFSRCVQFPGLAPGPRAPSGIGLVDGNMPEKIADLTFNMPENVQFAKQMGELANWPSNRGMSLAHSQLRRRRLLPFSLPWLLWPWSFPALWARVLLARGRSTDCGPVPSQRDYNRHFDVDVQLDRCEV